ncbi:MAG: DegT/DnrJ/EryC1/StrS family aminotransferase [Tannerellaceae bacterium]|nr:DegT/DnrJ/EryC1/StrS family aminotransferase [Tannerellaceae bacterium]
MAFDTIQMVDLQGQHHRFQEEIDAALQGVINSTAFINGPAVKDFATNLSRYLDIPYLIPCGNGTDALQIALMALGLQPGDEVIVPAFNYIAATEAAALLRLTPVAVDVDPYTFNIDPAKIEKAISPKTKAIIAVHLFGQACPMDTILQMARSNGLYVIEDNAQSIGATYTFPDGTVKKTGTMGDIGTFSFFPSKPLACYGDGGALATTNKELAQKIRMIASHGQQVKYYHKVVGCNSRLDSLQAAVLNVKLNHMDEFAAARVKVAHGYNNGFTGHKGIITPQQIPESTHIYHQYTIQVGENIRTALQHALKAKSIPSMVYYPVPLSGQEAFRNIIRIPEELPVTEKLCKTVLSLPIHTEMDTLQVEYIIRQVLESYSSLSSKFSTEK